MAQEEAVGAPVAPVPMVEAAVADHLAEAPVPEGPKAAEAREWVAEVPGRVAWAREQGVAMVA